MATFIRRKGDKAFYAVLDRQCIGRDCLRIHRVEKRGTYMDGSSRLISRMDCCARREGWGCPIPTPEYDKELAAQRRSEGMRNQEFRGNKNPSYVT